MATETKTKAKKDESAALATWTNDAQTGAAVIDSIVLRGDLSALGPGERARFYLQMCEGLGLNPHAQPFAFLRLNGKEVLYATRGATDQLAAMHRVNRKIIDGPKVVDCAGTKLVYAVCEASMPNGRVETATATIPVSDPPNMLMKCETKAKRRATLSILGLALLDEMEVETIPAHVQEPGSRVDLKAHRPGEREPQDADAEEVPQEPAEESAARPPAPQAPPALGGFYARVEEIELPGESVAVWMKYRADLAPLPVADREAAWRSLCKRTEEVGRMKNAKVWLKKAIAEEDARRGPSVGAQTPKQSDAPAVDPAPRGLDPDTMDSALAGLGTAKDLTTLGLVWTALTEDGGDWHRATDAQRTKLEATKGDREKALRNPPPDGTTGGRTRRSNGTASAQGAGAANDTAAEGPRMELDPEHAEATYLRRDAAGDRAWRAHLAANRLDRFALAHGWNKRRPSFDAAGVYDARRSATLDVLEPLHHGGSREEQRQHADNFLRGVENPRLRAPGTGEVIPMRSGTQRRREAAAMGRTGTEG